MIVRLMGEGQYRLDDALAPSLDELDAAALQALEARDEATLRKQLEELHRIVLERGERLDHAHLAPSDLIVPPADLSLDEARALFEEEGLIPDLPAQ